MGYTRVSRTGITFIRKGRKTTSHPEDTGAPDTGAGYATQSRLPYDLPSTSR